MNSLKLFIKRCVSFIAIVHFYWRQRSEVSLDSRMVTCSKIEVLLQAKKNSDNFEMALSSFLLNDFLPENEKLYYAENVGVT